MSLSLTGVMLGQVEAVGAGQRDPGAPAGGHGSPALPSSWAGCLRGARQGGVCFPGAVVLKGSAPERVLVRCKDGSELHTEGDS